jgi:NAD(P)H-hydrate epimerase
MGKASFLVGPGNEVTPATREAALVALATGHPCVLDADALSAFAGDLTGLVHAVHGPAVLTPHEGEFRRLFGEAGRPAGKLERTRDAARESRAAVLLKGPDTVIADPDGRAAINENAPPDLATAGSGDVLAGIIVGLLAQGMAYFEAACAGAWLHGACATRLGPGLMADDLPDALPGVLRDLRSMPD